MKKVLYDKNDHIAVITFNDPDRLNPLSAEMIADISEALDMAQADDDVFVVVVTGNGKAFVAGADIKQMYDMTALDGVAWGKVGGGLMRKIEIYTKPIIAAVNGFALGGGCELALACDFIYASEKAKMGLPEVGLGVIPGFGGTLRLPRAIGKRKAKEMAFQAKTVGALEAYEMGLVNKVVPPEQLMDEVLKTAKNICAQSQSAIREVKYCMNTGSEIDIAAGIELEAQAFGVSFSTEDKKIGMGAFLRKEKEKNFVNK